MATVTESYKGTYNIGGVDYPANEVEYDEWGNMVAPGTVQYGSETGQQYLNKYKVSGNTSNSTSNSLSSNNSGGSSSISSGGSSSVSSSGSSSSQTAQDKEAAEKATDIAKYNLEAIQNQLRQAIENYDIADTQNRSSANKQKNDASRKASGSEFGQTKNLQMALQALLSDSGTALNSSLYGDLAHAARTRMDLDLGDTYNTLLENWNTIENAYQDAANANQLSRNESLSNYIYNASQLASNLAADRYGYGYSKSNGTDESMSDTEKLLGISDLGNVWDQYAYDALLSAIAPYVTEDNSYNAARNIQAANTVNNGGYMASIANSYNNRKVS